MSIPIMVATGLLEVKDFIEMPELVILPPCPDCRRGSSRHCWLPGHPLAAWVSWQAQSVRLQYLLPGCCADRIDHSTCLDFSLLCLPSR